MHTRRAVNSMSNVTAQTLASKTAKTCFRGRFNYRIWSGNGWVGIGRRLIVRRTKPSIQDIDRVRIKRH